MDGDPAAGGNTPAGCVLVVDDDELIRDVVAEALEQEGCTVRTAPHGAAALEQLRQRQPAVILLDMRMP
ncbi:MAG: response regulator, partial [Chloroflexota bacterium]